MRSICDVEWTLQASAGRRLLAGTGAKVRTTNGDVKRLFTWVRAGARCRSVVWKQILLFRSLGRRK